MWQHQWNRVFPNFQCLMDSEKHGCKNVAVIWYEENEFLCLISNFFTSNYQNSLPWSEKFSCLIIVFEYSNRGRISVDSRFFVPKDWILSKKASM